MMDRSSKYKKMCDCPEIQGSKGGIGLEIEWLCEYGDYYVTKNRKPQLEFIHTDRNEYKSKSVHMWLPRQDQLQKMMIKYGKDPTPEYWPMFYNFSNWAAAYAIRSNYEAGQQFPVSMEQLWLTFVMKEKFNKTWNGEKWIGNE